ncbi:NTP transferase domain-containing protein [uncultured Klebsiella sp.]|uniref:nucleotidyltransferase family protein n=1 Tax=uncultured Klebsiella sp. TaxID=284011 RepID=UPI0021AF5939|nr:NTP transferase domain-containing protein [uncultured Klebsiella sp.]
MLAAGLGERFKQAGGQGNKLLAQQRNGQPLLALTLQQAKRSGLPLLLVTRPDYPDILALARQYQVPAITLVSNGSGESIAAGVQQTRAWPGWLIQPGDMAWVTAQDHRRVATALADGAQQVRLCWQQQPGHPVGFARGYGEALSRLSGDNGARTLLDPAILKTLNAHAGVIRDADLPVINRS